MDLQDFITEELINKKSLAALIWLIDRGRELEFRLGDELYFLSRSKSSKTVSLWAEQNEQSFDSMEELIQTARIQEKSFCSLWRDIIIETLF